MAVRSFAGLLRQLACLSLAVLLASCGGGGSDEFGAAPAGTMTLQQREEAMSRLAQHFEQVVGSGDPTAAQWEALRAWAASQPAFSEVGLGDRVLWARFTDGRYFLFSDDWRPLPPTGGAAQSRSLPLLKDVPDVPQNENALLLRFFDEDFAPAAPVMQRMSKALADRGWTVGSRPTLTVGDLRKPTELGFLFVTSHSGDFGPVFGKEFALMTEDQVSEKLDAEFRSDLEEGRLIYHRTRVPWKQEPRYAITSKFVRQYMKFSPNSLVILLSCNSGSSGAAAFRQALFDQGAGTVIGWEGNSNPLAFPMVDLMIDRLAGTNAVEPVSPPNRPHVFDEVWDYLDAKGLLVTPAVKPEDGPATVRRFGAGFRMLQPIASELEVTGTDKLVIHGEFGPAPVQVTVGGKELPATVAADGKSVDVDLGFAAEGPVLVTQHKRTSNPRVLGSWRGQVKYTQQSGTGSCGPVLSDAVTLQLHLRADMHGTRDKIDGPVRNNRWVVVPSGDSQGSWQSSGQCVASDGSVEERWTGNGAFPLYLYDTRKPVDAGALYQNNVLLARVDALERRFQLALAPSPVAQQKSVFDGSNTQPAPLAIRPDLQSFLNLDGDFTTLMPYGMFLPWDGSAAVPAGHYVKKAPEDPDQILTVDWQAMPVSPAYDDKIGW